MLLWLLLLLYVVVMIIITFSYALKFDSNQTNSWITSSIISLSIEFFIQEPILIILNAVIRTILCSYLNK